MLLLEMPRGFTLGAGFIRFTPEGGIVVLDAIRAVAKTESPEDLWRDIREEHPDVLRLCDTYRPEGRESLQVVDLSGWEKIRGLLPPATVGVGGGKRQAVFMRGGPLESLSR